MASEYVDRAAIKKSCCEKCDMHGENGECFNPDPCEDLLAAFIAAPTADMEQVTRCKDCYQSVVIGEVLHCTYWNKDTDENGYCHEGG